MEKVSTFLGLMSYLMKEGEYKLENRSLVLEDVEYKGAYINRSLIMEHNMGFYFDVQSKFIRGILVDRHDIHVVVSDRVLTFEKIYS
jgi:hypothetical protein